jgi:hypothetical protein
MEKDDLAPEIEEEEVSTVLSMRIKPTLKCSIVLTAQILSIHMPTQEGEIEYVEGDDIEMGDMDDMEDFEGLVGEDGKPFLCFC